MATSGRGGDAAETRPKAKVSPARNVIGLVLLVGFSGAAIAEFLAYRGHASAVSAMQGMLPKDEKGLPIEDPYTQIDARPSKDKVEKAIGIAAPAKLKDEGVEQSATYNWRGLFRTHKLRAYYTKPPTGPPALIRIETE